MLAGTRLVRSARARLARATRVAHASRVAPSSRSLKSALTAVCLALLLLTSTTAHADLGARGSVDGNASAVVDLLMLRPLGFLAFGTGAVLFLFPVAPIVLITRPQEIAIPLAFMVGRPAQYVFIDPLGSH